MPKNKVELLTDFELAIEAYKKAEKKVAVSFIEGIISLGSLLSAQKKIWKPKRKWEKYLEEINKSLAGANQFIRLHEYSQAHLKELKESQLTNWGRLNSFLALPEELRIKLSEELNKQDASNIEFAKKVQEIQPIIDLDKTPGETLFSPTGEGIELDSFLNLLQEENEEVTDNSKDMALAMVQLRSGVVTLQKKKTTQKLSNEEKKYWNNLIKGIVQQLKSVSRELL